MRSRLARELSTRISPTCEKNKSRPLARAGARLFISFIPGYSHSNSSTRLMALLRTGRRSAQSFKNCRHIFIVSPPLFAHDHAHSRSGSTLLRTMIKTFHQLYCFYTLLFLSYIA
jgi:hypothetical protein